MSWQEQLVYHVKDDQRRHSIIGESFPTFGEGEEEKALGVTKKSHVAGARRLSFACGHRIVLACHRSSTLYFQPRLTSTHGTSIRSTTTNTSTKVCALSS